MIHVMVFDDNAIVRRGLAQILAKPPDIRITGESGNTDEVWSGIRNLKCDVLVIDIDKTDKDGLEFIRELREKYPDLAVLALSMISERSHAIRALEAGASGYLNVTRAPDKLVAAVRRVARGQQYVSPESQTPPSATVRPQV